MKALVLGGYGAVGAQLCAYLKASGHDALTAGRDQARADVVMSPRDPDLRGFRDHLHGVDVVINAAGLEDPQIVALVTGQGAAFVDVTASTEYVTAVERLAPAAPVLLSVGLAPGLTNLLADSLAHGDGMPARIDLAVVLGAGEAHGAAAVAWSLGLLGRRFRDPSTGDLVRNYTSPGRFELPDLGRRRLFRADFSDQHTLTRDLGIPVRTFFGLDSTVATSALPLLTRIPAAGRALAKIRLPGSDRWLLLALADDGRARWASGRSQSRGTAAVAAWAAGLAGRLSPGVHHLHRAAALSELPSGLPLRLGQRSASER